MGSYRRKRKEFPNRLSPRQSYFLYLASFWRYVFIKAIEVNVPITKRIKCTDRVSPNLR